MDNAIVLKGGVATFNLKNGLKPLNITQLKIALYNSK